MNEPETAVQDQVFEIAYDQRSSTWGHYIEWREWKYLDNENFHQIGGFVGWLEQALQVGDHFILQGNDQDEETLLLLEVMWVMWTDPEAPFYCDAVLLGRTEELAKEENERAEDATESGRL